MSYRFGSSRPRYSMKKPVEVDKEYEADIENISRRGDGVAKIEGFIIFVPETKKGDHVKFKVKRVGSRFAIGELVQAGAHITKKEGEIEKETEKNEVTFTHSMKLSSIEGIGDKRAEKLKSCGVNSIKDLANFDPKTLSGKLQISEKRVAKWINEAKKTLKQ